MKEEIYLPRMGQTMTEGTLNKWLKNNGDIIEKGESVAEITTDKVTATIESPKAGVFRILIEEGTTVPVGEIIAEVVDENTNP